MIRKATIDDIQQIGDTYNEHFEHEQKYGAFTVFQKGVYPTQKDATRAINAGSLYVYEIAGNIAGSIIADKRQPLKYEEITWRSGISADEVMIIHLLIVRPSMTGKGIASSLVGYAIELAKNDSCKALRLDTGSQNTPALSLYKKLGFQVVASSSMKVGDAIEHRDHVFLEKEL